MRFLNLQKAYDALYHDILLTKFYEYVSRDVNNFWKSYLDNPDQYISISGETTSCQKIETGVPKEGQFYVSQVAGCDGTRITTTASGQDTAQGTFAI